VNMQESYTTDEMIETAFSRTPFYIDAQTVGWYPFVKHVYLVDDLTTLSNPEEIYNGDGGVKIKWTDPDDINTNEPVPCAWAGTVVVRKEGSAPRHRWDGTLIVDSTTRDEYSVTAFEDDTVEVGKTYYYGIFPYDTKGDYRFTKVININTTEPNIHGVKYIQSDKTKSQYIDTELNPNAWYDVEISMKYLDVSDTGTAFGCRRAASEGEYTLTLKRLRHYAGWWWSGNSYADTGVNDTDWHKYFVDGSRGAIYVDDVEKGTSSAADNIETYPKTFYIFACNDNTDGAISFSSIRVEYIKIWDKEGVLVRNFIPALDENDVPSLYDKVTRRYYYNEGSGDFGYEEL
jgi:hypothetical protein